MASPGDELLSVAYGATSDCVIVAPYIQSAALATILDRLSNSVDISVLTRWNTADLVSGVSDPEVWSLLKKRGARLFLLSNLHAKYYRADDKCLIGSANLTYTGLGWSVYPNVEILWQLFPVAQRLLNAEAEWFADALRVNDSHYERARALADTAPLQIGSAGEQQEPSPLVWWWPRLRTPGDLWSVYRGEELPPTSQKAGEDDLAVLRLPNGLSRQTFENAVANELQQSPAVAWVDAWLSRPRRFGEMRDAIQNLFDQQGESRPADEAWQTMIRWLLHYLPESYIYRRPHQTEILERVDSV